jgi:two-component system, LytTR family, sensor kinase
MASRALPDTPIATPATDPGPSLLWLGVTTGVCALVGFVPLDQALDSLKLASPVGPAFRWQMASAVVWFLAARPIARRWSLADSQAGALGGLGALALVSTIVNANLVYRVLQPPSPYSPFVSCLELTLALLPTHALTLCLISLVGSWTSARRQRDRAADREAVLSASVVRAELDALRTRLQPHFLLNALNTVVGLARRNDGDRAADVAVDLGELLRFSLVESGDAVAFDAEREIVERYLAIEQARLGDRLRVSWQLDPSARTTRLPALMWQPLVENAIRHGISRRQETGQLTLTAERRGAELYLIVDADGPAAHEVSRMDTDSLGGLGLGLATVQRRLELLYGPRARVSLTTREEGSRTELIIPVVAT